MNKLILLYVMMWLGALGLSAGTTDAGADLVSKGDSAYAAKNYFRAIELYDSAIAVNGPSSSIYYNIGNAYYRVSQPGRAILSYERALRIDPTNRAARLNLDFVNTQTADKTTDSGNVLIQLAESLTQSMTADAWAWTSLSLFVVFLLLAAGYIFMSHVTVRKVCFFGGVVVLVLTVVSVITGISAAQAIHDPAKAVVTVPKASLSLSPGRTAATPGNELVIHEGHYVDITDSITGAPGSGQGTWYEVNVGNNTKAWIEACNVERVAAAPL